MCCLHYEFTTESFLKWWIQQFWKWFWDGDKSKNCMGLFPYGFISEIPDGLWINQKICYCRSNYRASKTISRFVRFLYIILCPHSRQRIGSLGFISLSLWHSAWKTKITLEPARVYNDSRNSYRNKRKPSKSSSPTLCCCWALGQTWLEVVLKSLNALITIKILFSEFHVLSPIIFCLQSMRA